MTKREIFNTVISHCYESIEGFKRMIDTEGYDNKAREERLEKTEHADAEHWHRIVRPCALSQEGNMELLVRRKHNDLL